MAWEEVTIGQCRLIRGDALEVLPTLEHVDAVITDPPYGVGLTTKTNDYRGSRFYDGGRSLRASVLYEDTPEAMRALIQEAMPLVLAMSRRAAIFCGNRLLHDYPKPTSMGAVYVSNGAGSDPWGFGCFNPILYYGKDPYLATRQGSRPNAFADNQPSGDKVDHPCAKPLRWMLWLVNRASLPGECVCDPFAGSFTTGVAAVQLGRRFVGIELDPYFWEVGCRRIEDATKQLPLFSTPVPAPHQEALL